MKLNLSLKTLAWSWGVLLTTCAAGAVALQVVDVVPAPETPPVQQAVSYQVAAQPTAPLFPAPAAPTPAAPSPTPAAARPEPAPSPAEPPKPHPPRQEAALPVPPIPPAPPRIRETREARVWRRPVLRAYAAEPQWQQPEEPRYWRGSPYPGQYYAYSEPWARMQGPPSYYPWPPSE